MITRDRIYCRPQASIGAPVVRTLFVQLLRAVGADSILSLTIVRPGLQSALEPPDAPELAGMCPPVSNAEHMYAIYRPMRHFLADRRATFNFDLFN